MPHVWISFQQRDRLRRHDRRHHDDNRWRDDRRRGGSRPERRPRRHDRPHRGEAPNPGDSPAMRNPTRHAHAPPPGARGIKRTVAAMPDKESKHSPPPTRRPPARDGKRGESSSRSAETMQSRGGRALGSASPTRRASSNGRANELRNTTRQVRSSTARIARAPARSARQKPVTAATPKPQRVTKPIRKPSHVTRPAALPNGPRKRETRVFPAGCSPQRPRERRPRPRNLAPGRRRQRRCGARASGKTCKRRPVQTLAPGRGVPQHRHRPLPAAISMPPPHGAPQRPTRGRRKRRHRAPHRGAGSRRRSLVARASKGRASRSDNARGNHRWQVAAH